MITSGTTDLPKIVSEQEWEAARDALLVKEKEATRARDALAGARRRLPMTSFGTDYVFRGPTGEASLFDLFAGRRQLLVYNFMFEPGAPEPCVGCSLFVDSLPHLAHLQARDTSLVLVSRALPAEIEAYRRRMGWSVPWYSSHGTTFNDDTGAGTGHRLTVFLRHGDEVFRTYYTTARGTEILGTVWTLLDLTPLGRQEAWEDSLPGRPQSPPYRWWRRHDEYEE